MPFPLGTPGRPRRAALAVPRCHLPGRAPLDVGEIEALLGDATFAALKGKVFQVEYFAGRFQTSKKKSITPRIDFDLGDEAGYGSPDASAGIGKDDFSIRWTGRLVAPATGEYAFFGDCDGALRIWLDAAGVIDKNDHQRREVQGAIRLEAGQACDVKVEYFHRDGAASNHVYWRGPGFEKRVLLLDGAEVPAGGSTSQRAL